MKSPFYLSIDNGEALNDLSQYRMLVGRLLYLTFTRPDICFTIHKLAQFMSNPTMTHWNAAIYILRYIKQQPGQGIFLSSQFSTQIKPSVISTMACVLVLNDQTQDFMCS